MKNALKNSKQQGMVLIMALILLLVITILGVSAVRMSGLDTQVAGNSIYSSLVFQGAESALGRASSDWYNIVESSKDREETHVVPDSYFNPVETVTGGVTLDSSATIVYQDKSDPFRNNIANDSGFEFLVFQINGRSRLAATAARDSHTEGVAAQIPPN